MPEIQPYASGASPFDSIKEIDTDGTERWSARKLQELMAYARWDTFQNPLQRAMATARNQGSDVETEFLQVTQIHRSGNLGDQEKKDYRLTRTAAYLVAMNGDPNKAEVAAAQAYFAVRTQQAEVAEQKRAVPSSFADALELAAAQQREIEAANSKVAALEPKAAKYDQLLDADGLVGMTAIADMLDVDVTTLTDWLVAEGIFRKQVSEGQRGPKTRNLPRRWHQHHGYFEVHPERSGRVKFPVAYATSAGLDLIVTKWGNQ